MKSKIVDLIDGEVHCPEPNCLIAYETLKVLQVHCRSTHGYSVRHRSVLVEIIDGFYHCPVSDCPNMYEKTKALQ